MVFQGLPYPVDCLSRTAGMRPSPQNVTHQNGVIFDTSLSFQAPFPVLHCVLKSPLRLNTVFLIPISPPTCCCCCCSFPSSRGRASRTRIQQPHLSLGCVSVAGSAYMKLFRRCQRCKEILKHHQTCRNELCPVCGPVKAAVERQKMRHAMTSAQHRDPLGTSWGEEPHVGEQ